MEYQLGTLGHQWIVDFIGRICWLVIVRLQHTIIVENDGNSFAGEVEMVAPVINPVLVVGVVEFIIQGHLDVLVVGGLTDGFQLGTQLVITHHIHIVQRIACSALSISSSDHVNVQISRNLVHGNSGML